MDCLNSLSFPFWLGKVCGPISHARVCYHDHNVPFKDMRVPKQSIRGAKERWKDDDQTVYSPQSYTLNLRWPDLCSYVIGLKETIRAVQSKKIKCIVVATNLQQEGRVLYNTPVMNSLFRRTQPKSAIFIGASECWGRSHILWTNHTKTWCSYETNESQRSGVAKPWWYYSRHCHFALLTFPAGADFGNVLRSTEIHRILHVLQALTFTKYASASVPVRPTGASPSQTPYVWTSLRRVIQQMKPNYLIASKCWSFHLKYCLSTPTSYSVYLGVLFVDMPGKIRSSTNDMMNGGIDFDCFIEFMTLTWISTWIWNRAVTPRWKN